jgi:DNA-binding NtrC family response regulator
MPDPLVLAGRPSRFRRTLTGAVELVGRSPAIVRVQELMRRAATSEAGTLITAEPGSAPESLARELHERGRHADGPYIAVECSDGDPAAVEALLFGPPPSVVATDLESVAGDSRIAAAVGGTLFLSGIADLPAAAQARLARIARDGEMRVDGVPVATALRIVGSASPGIDADVHAHRFRADLYRRLSGVRIDLPPLRDRTGDVPALAARLLEDVCDADGLPPKTFTETALALMSALPWTGNLAELHDTIARVAADTPDAVIQIEHLLPSLPLARAQTAFVPTGNLREARLRFERDYIASVLQHCGWKMADAAHTLGIQRPNLYRKARQLGIPLARLSE